MTLLDERPAAPAAPAAHAPAHPAHAAPAASAHPAVAEPRRRPVAARLSAVAVHLPAARRTTDETEARLAAENPGLRIPRGLIERLTGVTGVHVRPDGWQTSDLAVAAARDALAQSPGEIDLLVFASASQDLIEPATAHIVAAKLGVSPAVMDVKNACNSMVVGLQVAEALIATGQARRALVVSGEMPSHAVRWRLDSSAQFLRSFAGYTMSDGGAAVVLERADGSGAGILASRFEAHSRFWDVGTLPTGGSMNPHADGGSYFDMDGRALERAFAEVGLGIFHDTLAEAGFTAADVDFVAVHQVALSMHRRIVKLLGVDPARTHRLIDGHGNLASVSLPVQLAAGVERGAIRPGSLVALVGLAGGISLGTTVVRW